MDQRRSGEPAALAQAGKVFLVEDDQLLRRALERLLRTEGYEVEPHERLATALARPEEDQAACFVVDLYLPDGNGLDLLRHLAAHGGRWPAVVITGNGDVRSAVEAMRHGAIELLEKPFDPSRLLEATAGAVAESRRRTAEHLRQREATRRLDSLSARERQVFELVVEGLPSKRIASRLGVAEQTVKVHRMRVMEKTGADSLADLVRLSSAAGQRGQQP